MGKPKAEPGKPDPRAATPTVKMFPLQGGFPRGRRLYDEWDSDTQIPPELLQNEFFQNVLKAERELAEFAKSKKAQQARRAALQEAVRVPVETLNKYAVGKRRIETLADFEKIRSDLRALDEMAEESSVVKSYLARHLRRDGLIRKLSEFVALNARL